jgi:hypothetical protein
MHVTKLFIPVFILFFFAPEAYSQFSLDVEGDYIINIPYNTLRIPSKGGTRIDIARDLDAETTVTFRARLNYLINDRHVISALVAPLTIKSSGMFDEDVRYGKKLFAAGTTVDATYKFNSYRLTYRYLFVSNDNLKFGAGITAKVREANIRLKNTAGSSDYPDLGMVPLVNFYLHWMPTSTLGLLLEGDALGTNKGRAEDIFAGITFNVSESIAIKGGYRILEGGANVTDNYNFTWVNYAAIGAVISF